MAEPSIGFLARQDLDPWWDNECAYPDAGAVLSECGSYRYRLWRWWGDGAAGSATFVMLNPSTADAHVDDPTIRKCIGFAKRWGLHGIRVVNLFAHRSTDPKGLLLASDPVGRENSAHLSFTMTPRATDESVLTVFAWGATGGPHVAKLMAPQIAEALSLARARSVRPMCLGTAKSGAPRHPLMLGYSTPLVAWEAPHG